MSWTGTGRGRSPSSRHALRGLWACSSECLWAAHALLLPAAALLSLLHICPLLTGPACPCLPAAQFLFCLEGWVEDAEEE